MNFPRRDVLKGIGAGVILASVGGKTRPAFAAAPPPVITLDLPPLPYAYDALEPVINTETMTIHHDVHHAAYLAKLKDALVKEPSVKEGDLVEMLSHLDTVPQSIRMAVRNHGGGHLNHTLFWESMTPKKDTQPSKELAAALTTSFGTLDKFKELFEATGSGVFGSGWVWLVQNSDKSLAVVGTSNQDTPYTQGQIPLLGNDVWEHAYYLMYRSKRAEYLQKWWQVVNWDVVSKRFTVANA